MEVDTGKAITLLHDAIHGCHEANRPNPMRDPNHNITWVGWAIDDVKKALAVLEAIKAKAEE